MRLLVRARKPAGPGVELAGQGRDGVSVHFDPGQDASYLFLNAQARLAADDLPAVEDWNHFGLGEAAASDRDLVWFEANLERPLQVFTRGGE